MTVMTGDARRALTRLLNAFENHFDIARDGDEADDAALEAAELALRDAFFTYDDILFTQLGVELPFDILDDSEDDDDDFDDSDDDEEDGDEDDEDDDFIEVDDCFDQQLVIDGWGPNRLVRAPPIYTRSHDADRVKRALLSHLGEHLPDGRR